MKTIVVVTVNELADDSSGFVQWQWRLGPDALGLDRAVESLDFTIAVRVVRESCRSSDDNHRVDVRNGT